MTPLRRYGPRKMRRAEPDPSHTVGLKSEL